MDPRQQVRISRWDDTYVWESCFKFGPINPIRDAGWNRRVLQSTVTFCAQINCGWITPVVLKLRHSSNKPRGFKIRFSKIKPSWMNLGVKTFEKVLWFWSLGFRQEIWLQINSQLPASRKIVSKRTYQKDLRHLVDVASTEKNEQHNSCVVHRFYAGLHS